MSDSFEHNARVIGERWPALLARVQAEDAAVLQADLVEGLGSVSYTHLTLPTKA